MSDNYRMERIERLLYELRHEVTRGMMEGDIDETLSFVFLVPVSKSIPEGMVRCAFETRPTISRYVLPDEYEPRLRLVKS